MSKKQSKTVQNQVLNEKFMHYEIPFLIITKNGVVYFSIKKNKKK
jgi:hypothetical protein